MSSPVLDFVPLPPFADSVQLPGVLSDYILAPDSAGLSITGDIDLRAAVALDDWTPSGGAGDSVMVGKWFTTGNQRSYTFNVAGGAGVEGRLLIGWSPDGSTIGALNSTAAPTVSDGGILAIRATLDVNVVAVGKRAQFFTKATTPKTAWADVVSNVGWTQLGADVDELLSTSIFDSTAQLSIGVVENDGEWAGKIYAVAVFDGIAGTRRASPDFSTVPGARQGRRTPNTVTDAEGNVHTINGTSWKWAA